jgi:pyruvate-formate lyase-activating enzyme
MESIRYLPIVRSTVRRLTRRGVLWLGLRCDVRCKFCYDERVSAANKIWITLDEAAESLNKFRQYYQNDFVDFMGGEPTLHPRILDIVRHAATIGIRPTIITHAMHLADIERAKSYADAGIHDFLVSIHGIGDTVKVIHGRGEGNFDRQMRALDNLRSIGIPFRFNCTLIRDNLTQLGEIVELAAEKGARVINFLTFNPYFEWSKDREIEFQARHSEIVPYLAPALDRCVELGIEANVRYMPLCQLPGREAHVYTGFQLPYDTHEWDYNSWYDMRHPGTPAAHWYLEASRKQQQRHNYTHVQACNTCAAKPICDGFHTQYVSRWGDSEARPYTGSTISDPRHFIEHQIKVHYFQDSDTTSRIADERYSDPLTVTQFSDEAEHRAGVKLESHSVPA